MIFAVKVNYKKQELWDVSREGYTTLEGAMNFIKSRSDYKGQPFTNWCVETPDHIYMIIDIQIAE
jgi:hypothetical protein